MLFSRKFFKFPEKYDIRKIFWYIRKNFAIFREKCDISGKIFLVCPEKNFETPPPPPPVANFSRNKILGALFYSESALKAWPPPPNF
jgi:hypothetical protein